MQVIIAGERLCNHILTKLVVLVGQVKVQDRVPVDGVSDEPRMSQSIS